MTKELQFLDRQEAAATGRIQRALLGGDGAEPPVELIERATVRHPLLAVGGAAALGGLVGVVAGRAPGKALGKLLRFAAKPAWRSLRGALR